TVTAEELENAAGEELFSGTQDIADSKKSITANANAATPELSLANYKMELLLVALAVGMVVNYFRGSRQNADIGRAWEAPISQVLHANFSLVGDGSQVLERDSASDMLIYASGRRHCRFAQGHLMLRARQDPVASLNDFIAKTDEKLEIEVTMDDDTFSGFVFAAVPRRRAKAVGRDRYDVSTFTKLASNDKIPSRFAIFSESADATAQVLDSGLEQLLSDNDSLLEEIYITDCPSEKPETHQFKRDKKILATIRLPAPTNDGINRVRESLEFVFYLVDYIVEAIALRPESTRKLTKAREEAFKEYARQAEQEKQEALAKIVADRRRAELEEVDKMSPDQRRKWEEKERKRKLKKEQSKRTRRYPCTQVLPSCIVIRIRIGAIRVSVSVEETQGLELCFSNQTRSTLSRRDYSAAMAQGEETKISEQEEADLSSALIAKLLAEDSTGGGRYSGYYDDYGNAAAFNDVPDDCASGSEIDDDWDPSLKRRRKLKGSKSRRIPPSDNIQNDAADIASGSSDLSDSAGSQKKPKRSKKARSGPKQEKAAPQPVMPGQYRSGAYTDEEEGLFLEGLEKFGRSWSEISTHVVTRDAKSIRSHAQKYFIKLFRDKVPLPAKVCESGDGYTLSGRPLDPNSAAARPYLQHVMQLDPLPKPKAPKPTAVETLNVENKLSTAETDKETIFGESEIGRPASALAADNTSNDKSESPEVTVTEMENPPPKSPVRTLYAMSRPQRSQVRPVALRYNDPHQMVRCTPFAAPPLSNLAGSQPFKLVVHTNAQLAMDFHAHLMLSEVIGLLGGCWDARTRELTVTRAFPCTALETSDAHTNVEMDPGSELVVRSQIIDAGLRVVGWYHSHPTFRPDPSIIDIENQTSYQALFRDSESSEEPFVGAIVSPYDPELPGPASALNWFYVGKTAVDKGHPKSLQVDTAFDNELPQADQEMLLQLFNDTRNLKHSALLEEAWRLSSTELRSLKMAVSLSHRMPWLCSPEKLEIPTPPAPCNESAEDVELPAAANNTTESEAASIDEASDCTATEPSPTNGHVSIDGNGPQAVGKCIPQKYLLTGQKAIQDQFLLGLYRHFKVGIFKTTPSGEVANTEALGRVIAAYHYSSRSE
ncbi:hypothetical protein H4R24_004535, partial [Coemansia sp. RSA 988]